MKDSGKRQQFESGMVRDVTEGKKDFSLILDGPMFDRWAEHLTKGAEKYSPRNWMLAEGGAEYARFRQSAFRHFLQWMRGDVDEDHAAAVFFNINGAEYVKARRMREHESDFADYCDCGGGPCCGVTEVIEHPPSDVKCNLYGWEYSAPCTACAAAGKCLAREPEDGGW